MTFALFAWLFGPSAWNRVALIDAKRRCRRAAESVPADLAVIDTDPARGAANLASDPQYSGEKSAVIWFSREWEQFAARLMPPGRRPSPTLFFGQLRSPSGKLRFVVVTASWTSLTFGDWDPRMFFSAHADVIDLGTALSAPTLVASGATMGPPRDFSFEPQRLRLRTGQRDRVDLSHFTVSFDGPDENGTIDGWLRDDDTVWLERRVTPPPPPSGASPPSPG